MKAILPQAGTPAHLPDWPLHLLTQRYNEKSHGDFSRWAAAIAALPDLAVERVAYGSTVSIHTAGNTQGLSEQLRVLHPWRKGPFQIADVFIDTEWRSDWKWQRLAKAGVSVEKHRILDIGCGNGYFGWRMLQAGANEVVGIDPTLVFCMQHQAIQRYLADNRNYVLPLRVEELPPHPLFDSVFSMGVIYHRREPQQHIDQLIALTQPGGQIIVESIVSPTNTLYPEERYARMRNVSCIPTVEALAQWMTSRGLHHVECLDTGPTTTEEQRTTSWMTFESLAQALDPADPTRTIEGYPAPHRALLRGWKAS